MAPTTPVQKITFQQWLRHPTTAMMVIAVSLVWIAVLVIINMSGDRVDDWKEECGKKDKTIAEQQQQIYKFTNALIIQMTVNRNLADSVKTLKGEKQ